MVMTAYDDMNHAVKKNSGYVTGWLCVLQQIYLVANKIHPEIPIRI